jgi:elongation factor P
MYNASDLRKGLKVEIESEPYEITEYNFTKPGKGQAFYTCRLKHMVNGSTLTRNYRSADKIDQPQLTQRDLHYSYQEGSNFVFMDENYEQVLISADTLGESQHFLSEDLDVQVLFHNGKAVEVTLPTFVVKTIVVTEPGARGNTATNVFKPAQVEGGYEIQVPLFINEGDLVRVDTRTGKYADRVNKK